MPEYFEISLIAKKTERTAPTIKDFLAANFDIVEGRYICQYFENREVVFFIVDNAETHVDFEEIAISLPEQVFHRNILDTDLIKITDFVNSCFEHCEQIIFAVCSYEINGYLLSEVPKLEEFDDKFLKKVSYFI